MEQILTASNHLLGISLVKKINHTETMIRMDSDDNITKYSVDYYYVNQLIFLFTLRRSPATKY